MKWLSKINKKYYFFYLPSTITFLILFILVNTLERSFSKLSFNIKSENSGVAHIYINNLHSPTLFDVKKNIEQTLEVNDLTLDINMIRIDPPKVLGSKIEISNIIFENSEKIFKNILIDEILKWGVKDLKLEKVTNEKIIFTVIGNDPYLVTGSRIIIDSEFKFLNFFLQIIDDYKLISLVTILLIYLTVLPLFLYFNFNYKIIFSISFISVLSSIIFLYVPNYQFGFSSVNSTIGRGVYSGLSNFPNQLSIMLTFILSVAIAYFSEKKLKLNKLHHHLNTKVKIHHTNNFLYPLSLFFISFILLTPDLLSITKSQLSNNIGNDWDSNNINTWKYMISKGLIPYIDFWFPYGGRSIFYIDTPYGDLFLWIYKSVVYGTLGTTLYYLFRGNIFKYILIVSILIYGEQTMIFWGASRYLLAFTVVFSFLCINYKDKIFSIHRFLFWVNAIFAIFFEANLLIYCAPAIIFKLFYDYFEDKNFKLILRNFLINFLPVLIFFIVFLLFCQHYGILKNWFEFYLNIGDQSIIGSEPTNLVNDPLKILILSSPFIALVISLYSLLTNPKENKAMGFYMISIGLIGTMLLMKHLVRPMDWQLFIIPTLIVILLFNNNLNYTNKFNLSILGVVFGLILFMCHHHHFFKNLVYKIQNSPALLINNYHLLLDNKFKGLIKEVKGKQFSRERYSRFEKENVLVNFLVKDMRENDKVYVLNDNNAIYILLNQIPPYHISLYNASPIYEQNKNIVWLKHNKPKFVIWDKKKNFDLVPNIIRSPIIYEYIVNNYVFYKTISGFDIFKERSPYENINESYWNNHFNNHVDLGFIPGASNISKYDPCIEITEGCRPVLHLKTSMISQSKKISLNLIVNNKIVKVSLMIKPSNTNYYILLDRLLFWWLLKEKPKIIKVEGDNKIIIPKFKYYKIPKKVLY